MELATQSPLVTKAICLGVPPTRAAWAFLLHWGDYCEYAMLFLIDSHPVNSCNFGVPMRGSELSVSLLYQLDTPLAYLFSCLLRTMEAELEVKEN